MEAIEFAQKKATSSSCAHDQLRLAVRSVSQIYDTAMRPSGLRMTQYAVLATLAEHGVLRHSVLAEMIVLDRTSLTRRLKPLERDGLVHLKVDDDHRKRWVKITQEGRKKFEAATPYWQCAHDELLRRVGEPQLTELHQLLASFIERAAIGPLQQK